MIDPLADARTGERWVLRVRLADGSATDRIGWLEALAADTAVLAGPDGRSQPVDRSAILVARRAPAAPGGRDPRRISAAEVERHALPGWLADSEPLGEWTLRAAGGFTGRANSCHAVGDPGRPIASAAEHIIGYAARHGIAPMAMVVSGSAEEEGLRAAGWVDTYVPTQVLTARLAEVLGDRPAPADVGLSDGLDDGWLAAYGRSRAIPADRTIVRQILDGNPPRAFAAMTAGEEPVAIGRGHVSGDWLGVAAVWVDPGHRRGGRATAIMSALGHWAARQGCRYVYVQVDRENQVALTAYERLGFGVHHGYLYLAPPEHRSSSNGGAPGCRTEER